MGCTEGVVESVYYGLIVLNGCTSSNFIAENFLMQNNFTAKVLSFGSDKSICLQFSVFSTLANKKRGQVGGANVGDVGKPIPHFQWLFIGELPMFHAVSLQIDELLRKNAIFRGYFGAK